jgi:hypothetical protein
VHEDGIATLEFQKLVDYGTHRLRNDFRHALHALVLRPPQLLFPNLGKTLCAKESGLPAKTRWQPARITANTKRTNPTDDSVGECSLHRLTTLNG